VTGDREAEVSRLLRLQHAEQGSDPLVPALEEKTADVLGMRWLWCWPDWRSAAGVPRIGPEMSDEEVRSLRAENAELRRLLDKHQWAGLTPIKSIGACPECAGSRPPEGGGHRPGCAVAAALAAAGR
jgi:hypothetical protein